MARLYALNLCEGISYHTHLAGIPPLARLYTNFAMFLAILRPASPWSTALAVVAAVNAVIALVYYARVGKTMWMDPLPEGSPDQERLTRPLSGSLALALGISALFVIVAGVLPFQLAGVFVDVAKVITAGI